MRRTAIALIALISFLPASSSFAQSAARAGAPSNESQLLKSTEAFLRNLFAWGPEFKVTLGPLGPAPGPEFYTVPVKVTVSGQTDSGAVYVSKDGKTFFRGDMYSIASDPFAASREMLQPGANPSKGPADARVTVVEFSDFECPHCRELFEIMQSVEREFPQVRFVYEDFPLVQIHPWAETAAIAARCAYMQSPAAFPKMRASIFENQDVISAENVWDKLLGYATQAGLAADAFKACMSSPDAKKAVDADHANGIAVGVNSTPTVYVNGRPIVGGDKATIERFIKFELAQGAR
ncbi:MAG: thioredoxin domain-containing protein [Candidatus Acidiferrales bacterium]